ncbi:reactive mitochondrial oxygen species modulator 1-domain-containing protein [Pisolithus marmoratus]|nr:reactive mitochondrial oxygen species modulator 1-domain-containing protein [Pisolithus marmoratus]
MATPARHMQGPTVWQKCKMGALMGGGVGLTIGFIFGSYSILRNGAGSRGFLATLSQYMLSSAATFSFFLAIGSVIRNEGDFPPHLQPVSMQFASPLVRSRYEGAMRMRARWEAEKARQQSADS